eukprot:PITA_26312
MVHSLITNKQAGMLIQLDISKAYDKLSWSYIRAILEAYGFDYNWIKWVMALVTTAGCSILLNGSPSRTFKPSRDISIQRNISRILGFQRESLPVKYLGVPLTDKPLHKDIWEPILNNLKDKISKWTNRALNLPRRLILTKAILQSILIYMLFSIPSPAGVINNIRNIQRDFLWGKGEEKKKWALVAWDRVCKPKSHGGLGLHDPGILNRVLGAKIYWRWLKEIQAPWAKLWKHNYASEW